MKKYINWKQFDQAVDKMAIQYKKNNKDCVGIFGLPRGGLIFAVALSHRLDLPLYPDMWYGDCDDRILVVDDIADSGKTLEYYKNMERDVVIFTMHYHKQSSVIPDFWYEEKKDEWIVYPWEAKNSDKIQDYLKE